MINYPTIRTSQKAASLELESSCCIVDSWRMEVDDLKDRSSEKRGELDPVLDAVIMVK